MSQTVGAAAWLLVTDVAQGRRAFDLAELWHYCDLPYLLTWREVSLRYRQTILGILWAVIQSVMSMAVFTVLLGRLAGVHGSRKPSARTGR